MFGIAPTQAQDFALGLVDFQEVCTGQSLKTVKAPLDGISESWNHRVGRVGRDL